MIITPAALSTYERLRTQVLSQGPGADYDWAVFLHRGMLAWCLLWEQFPEPPTPAPRPCGTSPLDHGMTARQGVIAVLADMVLALQPEVAHDV